MPPATPGSRTSTAPAPSAMVACMAHVRRKFVDIHRSQGSPIAKEAIGQIAQLYAVEKEARGSSPDRRAERREARAAPVFDDLEVRLAIQLTAISGKSPLAAATRYALARMERIRTDLDHGILELDNNAAERGMRAIALGRKNYLFIGSKAGGKASAIADTLIETAKPNAVNPHAWLADTIAANLMIVDHVSNAGPRADFFSGLLDDIVERFRFVFVLRASMRTYPVFFCVGRCSDKYHIIGEGADDSVANSQSVTVPEVKDC